MQIARFPRINLTNLPTPLQEMPRLTKKLDGPRLLVKRDDLTGLAMGGNKARKLEFIMADAKSKGADVIVTGAGLQSNWSTLTTAAAGRCGIKTIICSAGPTDGYKPEEYGGNMLLSARANSQSGWIIRCYSKRRFNIILHWRTNNGEHRYF